jgi:hypothetical protein
MPFSGKNAKRKPVICNLTKMNVFQEDAFTSWYYKMLALRLPSLMPYQLAQNHLKALAIGRIVKARFIRQHPSAGGCHQGPIAVEWVQPTSALDMAVGQFGLCHHLDTEGSTTTLRHGQQGAGRSADVSVEDGAHKSYAT